LQRVSDAKCFSAWVVSFDEHSVVVDVAALEGLDVGEKFHSQISGPDACAMFEGELRRVEGTNLAFEILSRIQARPPYEDVRVRSDLEGIARVQDDSFSVCVEDVSAGGLGFLSQRPLERWTWVTVVVKTAYGSAKVEGQVRYFKPIKNGEWAYRIGVQAPEMKHSLPLFGIRCSKIADAA
jgi:hypothetical protein